MKNLVNEESLSSMNKLVFRIFLPLLIFMNIYSVRGRNLFSKEGLTLLVLVLVYVVVVVIISFWSLKRVIKDQSTLAVMVQGIYRSNLAIFGLPISVSIYGEENLGPISLLLIFIIPLFNIIAVLLLGSNSNKKISPRVFLFEICKNPLVLGSLAGVICILLNIELPDFLFSTIRSLSRAATPMAFIVLGGTIQFGELKKDAKNLLIVCGSKLILVPGLLVVVAILMGFRNEYLVALLGALASPAAVASFTMAKDWGLNDSLAGEIVAVSTVGSIGTMFCWIYLLGHYHLI